MSKPVLPQICVFAMKESRLRQGRERESCCTNTVHCLRTGYAIDVGIPAAVVGIPSVTSSTSDMLYNRSHPLPLVLLCQLVWKQRRQYEVSKHLASMRCDFESNPVPIGRLYVVSVLHIFFTFPPGTCKCALVSG